ncbi:MAG: type IV pilus modification PilV family protein [Gemmatimonadaceae bacterium]
MSRVAHCARHLSMGPHMRFSARRGHRNRSTAPGNVRRGMSLIEVVVAMVLFGVIMASMAALTTQVARSSQFSSIATERAAAVATVVNQLEALPYDSLPGRAGCRNIASPTFPRRECVRITNVAPRTRQVEFTLTPANTSLRPDTVIFVRGKPTPGNPLNTS